MSKTEEGSSGSTGLAPEVKGFGVGEITRLSDDLFIAGQISEAQIKAIAEKGGIKSIMNLRKAAEETYLQTEETMCKALGVQYVHWAMGASDTSEKDLNAMLVKLDTMAKPVLVHCRSAVRAAAVAVAHKATREALQPGDVASVVKATPFGSKRPAALVALFNAFTEDRLQLIHSLPDVVDIDAGLVVGPQLTEEQLTRLVESRSIKTVINLRSPDEAGQLGLGVLAREPELVAKLGAQYINLPSHAEHEPSEEDIDAVRKALTEATKPVFLHCRRMRRTAAVVRALGLAPMSHIPAPAADSAIAAETATSSSSSSAAAAAAASAAAATTADAASA